MTVTPLNVSLFEDAGVCLSDTYKKTGDVYFISVKS